jgi:hypothetical protein
LLEIEFVRSDGTAQTGHHFFQFEARVCRLPSHLRELCQIRDANASATSANAESQQKEPKDHV